MVTKQYSTDPKLGNWVSRQRSNYKWYQEGKPSHMAANGIREPERIGFNWEPHCVSWNERFDQLCEYKVQFGHCRVPNNLHKHLKLGKWVSTQRTNYRLYQKEKPSDITAGRIREIDGIGFDWGTTKTDLEAIWSVRFQQLCEFKVHAVTVSCLSSILKTPNSGTGFRSSAATTSGIRKESQVPRQRSAFERSRGLDSN